ncbi:hypothetical protein [Lapillicoccus sp.]|uniref:hypothetical protein n=1 Tax=Lapillicoccus sp. TaxID=1909287 RepID=UPI0025D665F4|nr:hypothetical protein [Lapillicoccus sp.]
MPDDVRRVLAAGAAARGQSLQAYLLAVLTAEARRTGNLTLLGRFTGRVDGTWISSADPALTLDPIRAEREASLTKLTPPSLPS